MPANPVESTPAQARSGPGRAGTSTHGAGTGIGIAAVTTVAGAGAVTVPEPLGAGVGVAVPGRRRRARGDERRLRPRADDAVDRQPAPGLEPPDRRPRERADLPVDRQAGARHLVERLLHPHCVGAGPAVDLLEELDLAVLGVFGVPELVRHPSVLPLVLDLASSTSAGWRSLRVGWRSAGSRLSSTCDSLVGLRPGASAAMSAGGRNGLSTS